MTHLTEYNSVLLLFIVRNSLFLETVFPFSLAKLVSHSNINALENMLIIFCARQRRFKSVIWNLERSKN